MLVSHDLSEPGLMKTASITSKGPVRDQNQDRYLVNEFSNGSILLTVADGAGGEPAGAQAAELVIEGLNKFQPDTQDIDTHMVEFMKAADQKILEMVEKEPDLKGMGSTMTAAFLRKGILYWVHVGDSRLYLFRGDELTQVTEDDTMAGFLLTEGEITKEEARIHPGRNFLFECIGCGHFEVKTGNFEVQKGDLILLTTDGLHDKLPEDKMVSILTAETDLEEKLEGLVSSALEASGRDNVTVVGAEI